MSQSDTTMSCYVCRRSDAMLVRSDCYGRCPFRYSTLNAAITLHAEFTPRVITHPVTLAILA